MIAAGAIVGVVIARLTGGPNRLSAGVTPAVR
jgi:hypothetical protein